MKRGKIKRLLRQATRLRIRAEREAIASFFAKNGRLRLASRIEETEMLNPLLKGVPSVFAFAEKLNPKYQRPMWADQRYGAK